MLKEISPPIAMSIGTIIVIIALCLLIDGACDIAQWNNGHCLCGGNWSNKQTIYAECIYHCDRCEKSICLSKCFEYLELEKGDN